MVLRKKQALCMVALLSMWLACRSERHAPAAPRDAGPTSERSNPDVPDGAMPAQSTVAVIDPVMPKLPQSRALPEVLGDGIPDDVALRVEAYEGCSSGCGEVRSLLGQQLETQEQAPPPLSGGSLLLTRDGKWLVAADSDRDRVYFVDVTRGELSHTQKLAAGSEPGRLIEDDAGRIHVALRGRAALLSMTLASDSQPVERATCSQPRGLAYDAARESVHVACADGQLVSLPAEPSGAITRTLNLGRDLRDVLVRDDELLVTRFRAAELLRIRADGTLKYTLLPPASYASPIGSVDRGSVNTPTVAWRAIDLPGKGVAILHQRANSGEVKTSNGGYGGAIHQGMRSASIVQTALTVGLDGARTVTVDLTNSVLALDMAVSPSGDLLAVASPGNWRSNFPQIALYPLSGTSPLNTRSPVSVLAENVLAPGVFRADMTPVVPADVDAQAQVPLFARTFLPTPDGQISSLAFVDNSTLAVFEREPAAISLIDLRAGRAGRRIELSQESRYDTGHALFHMGTSAGLACASCHPEAGDDAHVWKFEKIGARRTQSLRGGILGTEPFHWDGDMYDFDALVFEVMVERMALQAVVTEGERSALARWIDKQPRFETAVHDETQVARGKALFEADSVGCASCHAGALLTNNQSVDVGTGNTLQVPALRGVSFRLPVMHDGCAKTLAERFEPDCGGKDHGNTSQLSGAEIDDLVAYLETL